MPDQDRHCRSASSKGHKGSCKHPLTEQHRRADVILELEDRVRSVQAENQLLGRLVQDFQAEKEKHLQNLSAATEAQQQAEHSAAHDKQRADDLQHQLAAAQQEQQRLRSSHKAQASALEKSRSMQDDMADVLLSLKQESEDRGCKLLTATKRISNLKDKLKHTERHLADAHQQRSCLEQEARSEVCSHQQAMSSWKGENERLRERLSSMQQHLQEALSTHESDATASGEAYHSLQVRLQALQSSLAEHTVCSNVSQHSLQQQVQSLQSEVQAVRQERDVALAGLEALQMCDEKKKCSLHVGLSQIGEVRQQVVEAHRRCSDQQATIVQLHQRLLHSQQDLQAKEAQMQEWRMHARGQQHLTQGSQVEQDKHTAVVAAASSTDEVAGKTCEQAVVPRGTLAAARQAEVCVMLTLQSELRRVHVLERMCLSDVAEINTLHHQLHASQQCAWSLRDCMLRSSMGQTRLKLPGSDVALPALCLPCQ
ncbi:TPA: hypothetical protein ACH3X1_005040 [Trebouxia sp. C0004]